MKRVSPRAYFGASVFVSLRVKHQDAAVLHSAGTQVCKNFTRVCQSVYIRPGLKRTGPDVVAADVGGKIS